MVKKKIQNLLSFFKLKLVKISNDQDFPIEADIEIKKLVNLSSKFSMTGKKRMYLLSQAIMNVKNNNLEADFVEVWGSGKPKREFLYVDDVADACVFLLQNVDAQQLYDDMKISHINIGYGVDLTIAELSNKIAKIVEYNGKKELNFRTGGGVKILGAMFGRKYYFIRTGGGPKPATSRISNSGSLGGEGLRSFRTLLGNGVCECSL